MRDEEEVREDEGHDEWADEPSGTGGYDECTAMDWEREYEPTYLNIYHAHWEQYGLDPMPVWFMPGVGDCDGSGAFAIGWMFSEDAGGTGAWSANADGSYSLFFNNAPH